MRYIVFTSLFVLGMGCKSEVPKAAADAPAKIVKKAELETAGLKEKVEKKVVAKKVEVPAKVATVGKAAPAFTLKDQDGKEHTLADLKGSIVVLEWTSPSCPYVVRHYDSKTMSNTFSKFPAGKVKWLAIDSSNFVEPEKSAAWKKEQGFDYPVLQDKDGKVGQSYAAKTTPHMYVIDAKGVLRYSGAIDDNPHGDKKEGITNYVETTVNTLLAGKELEKTTTKPYGCGVKYASK